MAAAGLDAAPSVLAGWLAYRCPAGPREPGAPLPAGAAGVARPGGGRPGAAAVGSPVDGPVSTAGSVPVAGGEEGLVHALCEGLRQGAPGDPDGTHPAARPVDVLCAPCCQHQAPQQKQLPGTPHGPCLLAGRPSQGGLETGGCVIPWTLGAAAFPGGGGHPCLLCATCPLWVCCFHIWKMGLPLGLLVWREDNGGSGRLSRDLDHSGRWAESVLPRV